MGMSASFPKRRPPREPYSPFPSRTDPALVAGFVFNAESG